VIVRTLEFVAILTAQKEPNFLRVEFFSEALKESLAVLDGEGFVFGEVFVVIGQGHERIFIGHFRFVHDADSPLTGTFKTAADTTATRESKRSARSRGAERDSIFPPRAGHKHSAEGMVARHLEPDAAAHREASGGVVLGMGARLAGEVAARLFVVDLLAFGHESFLLFLSLALHEKAQQLDGKIEESGGDEGHHIFVLGKKEFFDTTSSYVAEKLWISQGRMTFLRRRCDDFQVVDNLGISWG